MVQYLHVGCDGPWINPMTLFELGEDEGVKWMQSHLTLECSNRFERRALAENWVDRIKISHAIKKQIYESKIRTESIGILINLQKHKWWEAIWLN